MSAPMTSDCNQDAARAHGSSLQRLVSPLRSYYEDALVTLYHGDCREILPRIACDFIVTDPPYGVTDHEWDEVVPAAEWMLTKCAIVTASEPYATQLINSAPLKFGFDCVWVKNCVSNAMNAARMPMRRHERVLVFGDYEWTPQKRRRTAEEMARLNQKQRETMQWATPDTVLEYDSVNCRHGERTEHPSQKPVPLMEYLIKSFTSGIVCDPFAGSGSTLVAAKCAGRQIIGIERDERFCELSARRCAQEMAMGEERANAEVSHAAPPAASDKPTAQRGGVALH